MAARELLTYPRMYLYVSLWDSAGAVGVTRRFSGVRNAARENAGDHCAACGKKGTVTGIEADCAWPCGDEHKAPAWFFYCSEEHKKRHLSTHPEFSVGRLTKPARR